MKLSKIFSKIDEAFPFSLQENWDNSGLIIGDPSTDIKNIILGVDVTEDLIKIASEKDSALIFTHHPMIFRKFSKVVFDNPQNRKLRKMIKNDISYIAGHTNVDSAKGGINDFLADIFKPVSSRPLLVQKEKLFKIIVYVPDTHSEKVKKALNDSGAASIGAYDYCFFSSKGEGNFRAGIGSNPYIGEVGKIESVSEDRIETICRQRALNKAIQAMINAHPYEEVAYDVFEMNESLKNDGIGRIATLENPMTFDDIINRLAGFSLLPIQKCSNNNKIKKIAICSGSGGMDVARAAMRHSDLLITGELRFHDQFDLNEAGVSWVTLGHYESELCFVNIMNRFLSDIFDGKIYFSEELSID